jgi:hypothetical protein
VQSREAQGEVRERRFHALETDEVEIDNYMSNLFKDDHAQELL